MSRNFEVVCLVETCNFANFRVELGQIFCEKMRSVVISIEEAQVALSVECRTYDQEVVDSSLGRARGVETLGKFLTPMCLCSPSSISWYRPKGGDALWLGSKGRYGSCVGGR